MRTLAQNINVADNEVGFLFFAQSVEEMLFDRTPDSYRVHALTTVYRALEATIVCRDIADGKIKNASTVTPMAEELADSLLKDDIAQQIMGIDAQKLAGELLLCKHSVSIVKRISEYIFDKISDKYDDTCKNLLRSSVEEGVDREKIYRLTQYFCSSLKNNIYDEAFIYNSVISSMFYKRNSMRFHRRFDEFMSKFDGDNREYNVYIWVSNSFGDKISVVSNFEIINNRIQESGYFPNKFIDFFADRDGFCLIKTKIEDGDPIRARRRSIELLSYTRSIIYTVYADDNFCWNKDILVSNEKNSRVNIMSDRPHPLSRRDKKDSNEKKEQLSARINFALKKISGMGRYNNSIVTHSKAFGSENSETQLLAMWAALEALLPEPKGERIEAYIEYISSCSMLYYSYKRFSLLNADLARAHGREYDALLGGRVADSKIERLISVCVNARDGESYEALLNLVSKRNPLAHYRIMSLSEAHRNTRNLRDFIFSHNQRVKWQIQRIYNSRNRFVHTGSNLPYTETILRNLQEYYIGILHVIDCMNRDINNNNIYDLNVLFDRILTENKLYKERLEMNSPEGKRKSIIINDDNYLFYINRPTIPVP